MPNKDSAKKRVRQNEKRRTHNRAKRSDMRTNIKKVYQAIDEQQTDSIDSLVVVAQSKLAKAAKTNLIKKKNASRKISRIMKAVQKAKAA